MICNVTCDMFYICSFCSLTNQVWCFAERTGQQASLDTKGHGKGTARPATWLQGQWLLIGLVRSACFHQTCLWFCGFRSLRKFAIFRDIIFRICPNESSCTEQQYSIVLYPHEKYHGQVQEQISWYMRIYIYIHTYLHILYQILYITCITCLCMYVQIPRGSSVYRYLGKWKLVYKSLTFRSPSNAGRVFPCCSEPLCFKLTMSMEETRAVAWNILEHLGTLFAQLGVVISMVFSLSSRPLAISLEQQLSSRFIECHKSCSTGKANIKYSQDVLADSSDYSDSKWFRDEIRNADFQSYSFSFNR